VFCKAQETGKEIKMSCAIGDEYVNGIPYSEIVDYANKYIKSIGGFEKFAEWGLV
jgi:S-adenosylmethionine synthetase